MIYRIEVDVSKLGEAIDVFMQTSDFCVHKNVMFISTSYNISELGLDYIKSIKHISIQNYKRSCDTKTIERWCYDKLLEEELVQYEQTDDCQNKLSQLNEYIDILEKEMGVDTVASTEKKTGKLNWKFPKRKK